MDSNSKVMNTKFARLINIYNLYIGHILISESLNYSNFEFLNLDTSNPVFETLNGLKLKSFEYQVC